MTGPQVPPVKTGLLQCNEGKPTSGVSYVKYATNEEKFFQKENENK